MPEEFWPWINEVGYDLLEQHAEISGRAYREYNSIVVNLDQGWIRKDFAAKAVESDCKALLFLLLDGRDIAELVWKQIKPSGERSMKYISEDGA